MSRWRGRSWSTLLAVCTLSCSGESPADPAELSDARLEVLALHSFAGEAHAIVGLPNGDCVVAVSDLKRTEYGVDRRQALLVRYSGDGAVVWTTTIGTWPSDLAFDGERRLLIVGQTMDYHQSAWALVDVQDGSIQHSGVLDDYAKAGTFSSDGTPLVLTSSLGAPAGILEVGPTPKRWSFAGNSSFAGAMVPAPDGGVYVTLPHVDDATDTSTLFRLDRGGEELWRQTLCELSSETALAPTSDGGVVVATCTPVRLLELAPDGSSRGSVPITEGYGAYNPGGIVRVGDAWAVGLQLLGDSTVTGVSIGSWEDSLLGAAKVDGHGDALLVLHDMHAPIHFAHGHGPEVDTIVDVAAGADGSIWALGETRHALELDPQHRTIADAHGRSSAFVARFGQ